MPDAHQDIREAEWTARACPLCSGARPQVDLGTRSRVMATRSGRFSFVLQDCVCGGCGFAMAAAVPDAQFLIDYYASAFRRVKPDRSVPAGFDMPYRLALLRRHAAPGAQVLEVGAGDGAFVEAMNEAGFDARGIDLVDESGPKVVARDAFRAEPGGEKVDVVANYYVLEHIADPRGFLAACKFRLRDGGLLIVEVPNLETHPEAALDCEHLSYFVPATLKALVEACGFRVVAQEGQASRYFGQTLVARLERPECDAQVAPLPAANAAEIVAHTRDLITRAAAAAGQREAAARDLIARIVSDHRGRPFQMVAWGANQIATDIGRAAQLAGVGDRIVVDQSNDKCGYDHDGFDEAIRRPQFQQEYPCHRAFVICSEAWRHDIRRRIDGLSLNDISIYSPFEDKPN